MKKLLHLILLLCILYIPRYSYTQEPAPQEKQLLNYSVSLGLGYQSFVSFIEHEQAMESFLTLNLLAVYYPLPYLSLSYHLGLGLLSFYNISQLSDANKIIFPQTVNRINIENTLSLEFFGFINQDSLIYFGVGASYIYMGQVNKKDNLAKPNFYAGSEKHSFFLKTTLGSRFALYNNTLMDTQLYIMVPFKKMRSWSNEGERKFKQLVFGFEISIGYFD